MSPTGNTPSWTTRMAASDADFYNAFYTGINEWGLSAAAAYGYAALVYWTLWYGAQPGRIISGRRTQKLQQELIAEWKREGRNGPHQLAAAPAPNSRHLTGDAFDVASFPWINVWGWWAPQAGLRWGGTFSNPDPNHFDTGL